MEDSYRFYPIALDLHSKSCLVVGGGAVGCRKVEGLLHAGAVITVVAPTVCDGMVALEAQRKIRIERRSFQEVDVEGMKLVFACTDSPLVNTRVGEAARKEGALFNRADLPSDCDFAGMSVVARGSLLIAISTRADSPAYARWIREQVEAHFGPEYGLFLELLASFREEVKQRVPSEQRRDAWQQALDSGAFELVRAGQLEEAACRLRESLFAPENR